MAIERRTPRLQFSVLCENVATDQRGSLALLGIFDGIKAQLAANAPEDYPPLPFAFFVVNQWTNGLGLFHQHTEIADPSGRDLVSSDESEFYLSSPSRSHRVQEHFRIGLREPGRYTVRVFLENECALEYHFMFDVARVRRGEGEC